MSGLFGVYFMSRHNKAIKICSLQSPDARKLAAFMATLGVVDTLR
jgi:hypothetical protein